MCIGDLTAEHETNPGAARLRGEERHKQVRSPGEPRAFIVDPDLHALAVLSPADLHAAAGFERCVVSITQQVDQQLVELIQITGNAQRRTGSERYPQPCLHSGISADPLLHVYGLESRLWQPGQPAVGLHETAER